MAFLPPALLSHRFSAEYRRRFLHVSVLFFVVVVLIQMEPIRFTASNYNTNSNLLAVDRASSHCGAVSKISITPGAANNYFLPEGYKTHDLRYFNDLNTFRSIYQADIYNLAVNLSRQNSRSTFIDVGSGTGLKSSYLYDNIETNRKFVVIDFGPNLDVAKENFMKTKRYRSQKVASDIEFHEWDIDRRPFPTEIANDLITESIMVVADVIEHLVNPDQLVDKLLAVMKGCGTKAIIISTPDRDSDPKWRRHGPPRNRHHIREWGLSELEVSSCLLINFVMYYNIKLLT